jgi:hypothetical protein
MRTKPSDVYAPLEVITPEEAQRVRKNTKERVRKLKARKKLRRKGTGPEGIHVRLTLASKAIFKLHALQRRVFMTTLVGDLLDCWMNAVTDYGDPFFSHVLPHGTRAEIVPERWAGYLASLGYARTQDRLEDPTPKHDIPPPAAMPEPVQESRAEIPTEAPTVQPEMRQEEPPAQEEAPVRRGPQSVMWGNPAQLYDMGYDPSRMSPGEEQLRINDKRVADEKEKREAEAAEFKARYGFDMPNRPGTKPI